MTVRKRGRLEASIARGMGGGRTGKSLFRPEMGKRRSKTIRSALWLATLAAAGPALAHMADGQPAAGPSASHLSTAQMFALADRARDRGDYLTAEQAYRALAANPDADMRSEARFRLAMMLADREHRYRDAAVELRRILDEKPDAGRVRLELARIDARLGRVKEAARELRAAEAGGLPPEVEQMVRFYAQALDTQRPAGGSIELLVAPDSNVNRATASNTLGTVIGDFTLNRDARAHSGVGAAVRGQAYARLAVSNRTSLLARLSGSANLYRASQFDDVVLAPQVGPEFDWGRDKLSLGAGPAWRWYGMRPYTTSLAASADWQHRIGPRGQLRIGATAAHIGNRFDRLESSDAASLTVGVDRAFSSRFGGGVQISANRQDAREPGYATAGGSIGAYLFHELGRTTVAANLGYSHLEADRRLALFPERRVDNGFSGVISGIFRQVRIGAISPVIRLRYERNVSRIQLYDYRRFAGELGLATAF